MIPTEAPPTARLATRELPVEEWPRLLDCPGPYKDQGFLPASAHNRIIVLETVQTGEIVGYWGAFTAVHAEPVFIREAYRQKVSAVRLLWEAMNTLLKELQVPGVVAVISDQDAPVNLPMAVKLGFQRVPGALYFCDLTKEP